MGSADEVVEIDFLERRLLPGSARNEECETDDGIVLYDASFEGMEDNYLNYQTTQWILYSLLLILAWGVGLLMLLYLPIRRYVLRKDFQSRKLYLTSDAIVYKVTRPVPCPCLGVLKKEKHVLLPSIADIVVEQGYLQSLFGIFSIRIENAGVRRPASDDVQIQGLANPRAFRKAVLTRLLNMRGEGSTQQASTNEDLLGVDSGHPTVTWMTPSRSVRNDSLPSSGQLILQKLEEVGISVKRVQALIERKAQSLDHSI